MNSTSLTRLRERRPQIGTWLSVGSPIVAEVAALSGFDWLLIDLEHGSYSEAAVLPQLQALNGSSSAGVVRVGAPSPDLIARVLDWGAAGLMVPHISSAAEAEACVRAMRYAPRGTRGLSRTVRAYGYGLQPPDPAAPVDPVFFAQIETLAAVESAAAIAAVDGVDVLFVGPADLRWDLTAHASAKPYEDCLAEVVAAAHSAGKSAGILVRDVAEARTVRALGFTYIAIDSDLAILRNAYRQILSVAVAAQRT